MLSERHLRGAETVWYNIPPMNHLIEIRDLKKIYSAGEEPVAALDGVSLTIDSGEFVDRKSVV